MNGLVAWLGDFLTLIGTVSILYVVWNFVNGVRKFYWTYFTPSPVDFNSFGKWALVTGSTDGIGKGIAQQLAKRGLNIILVSRNQEKLKKVASEIERDYHVETKCITFDFSIPDDLQNGSSTYAIIDDAIEGLEVGILVNNVGIGADGLFLNAFRESDNKDLSTGIPRLVYCNTFSMAKVTQILLPRMLARKKGLIINISSLAGYFTLPGSAIYSASKRFVNTFTSALDHEIKNNGVLIQNIHPGTVRTNMTAWKDEKLSPMFPECENYVEHMMNTVGKIHATAGYRYHGFLFVFLLFIPEVLLAKILVRMNTSQKQ